MEYTVCVVVKQCTLHIVCDWHSDNQCGRGISKDLASVTPVGYRCLMTVSLLNYEKVYREA